MLPVQTVRILTGAGADAGDSTELLFSSRGAGPRRPVVALNLTCAGGVCSAAAVSLGAGPVMAQNAKAAEKTVTLTATLMQLNGSGASGAATAVVRNQKIGHIEVHPTGLTPDAPSARHRPRGTAPPRRRQGRPRTAGRTPRPPVHRGADAPACSPGSSRRSGPPLVEPAGRLDRLHHVRGRFQRADLLLGLDRCGGSLRNEVPQSRAGLAAGSSLVPTFRLTVGLEGRRCGCRPVPWLLGDGGCRPVSRSVGWRDHRR